MSDMSEVRRQQDRREVERAGKSRAYRDEYIYGTAVRKVDIDDYQIDEKRTRQERTAQKNREKANAMSFGFVSFMIATLALASIAIVSYINIQSEITKDVNQISTLESQLYRLQQENDEYEMRIESTIDLEQIKKTAMQELGMTYASDGQIVQIEGGSDDYVRKYADIPED